MAEIEIAQFSIGQNHKAFSSTASSGQTMSRRILKLQQHLNLPTSWDDDEPLSVRLKEQLGMKCLRLNQSDILSSFQAAAVGYFWLSPVNYLS